MICGYFLTLPQTPFVNLGKSFNPPYASALQTQDSFTLLPLGAVKIKSTVNVQCSGILLMKTKVSTAINRNSSRKAASLE